MKRTPDELCRCFTAGFRFRAGFAWPEKPIKSLSLGRGRKYRYGCLVAEGLPKRVESECQRGESAWEVLGWLAMIPLQLKRMAIPGIATVEITMMHHQGMTALTYQNYTPITRLAVNLGGVQVAANSQFRKYRPDDRLHQANPGKLKASRVAG
ncbi:hypothetical protein MJ570_00320 [Escherichia coli]|nr:hypothetical protein MJ570_00320 [Escherichia coli]